MNVTKFHNKILLSILTMIVCILFGCQKKEALLLTELQEESTSMGSVENINPAETGQSDLAKDYVYQTESAASQIMIHICGAVNRPGVYQLEEGDRICQAVEKAGGFTAEADEELLNQAQKLTDGMQLVIPTKDEAEEIRAGDCTAKPYLQYGAVISAAEEGGLININTATEEQLCTLPGIGSEKAQNIIAYRIQNGSYKKIEDIMKVTGIKSGMFQKIKDKIVV